MILFVSQILRGDWLTKTQGTVDVLIALSGAAGGALSGMVVAGASYLTLSLGGGILSLLLIPVVIWSLGNKE